MMTLDETKIRKIVSQMTLEEKVAQLNIGRPQFYQGVVNERWGIPAFMCADGPRGSKGASKDPCYPIALAQAATWDVDLMERTGNAYADHMRQYGKNMLFAPGVDMNMSPLAGRNSEYYGEDPVLSGKMAAAFCRALERNGIVSTMKHYAVNDFETGRTTVDVHVPENVLNELFLKPFRIGVQEGGTSGIMTTYNSLNGHYTANNRYILQALREWGFQGVVVSDWFSVMEEAGSSLSNGHHLELHGYHYYTVENVKTAMETGRLSMPILNKRVEEILRVKFSHFDGDSDRGEYRENLEEQRATALELAKSSCVLLKNDGILPLKREASVALIGPMADSEDLLGNQGSSTVSPEYVVTAKDYFETHIDDLVYAKGCLCVDEEGKEYTDFTCTAKYYNNWTLAGDPVLIRTEHELMKDGFSPVDEETGSDEISGAVPEESKDVNFYNATQSVKNDALAYPGIDDFMHFSAEFTGTITARKTTKYAITVTSNGGIRLYVDGKCLIDQFGKAWVREKGERRRIWLDLEEGRTYSVKIEFMSAGNEETHLYFRYYELDASAMIAEAVEAAKKQDVAVVMVGVQQDLMQGEANDNETYILPGCQNELIQAVSAANPNTVVLLSTSGGAEVRTFLPGIRALMEVFYPGQEGAEALYALLYGEANPSGKLPMTYPTDLDQVGYPTMLLDYPDDLSFFGYRYYQKHNLTPQFPFGFGLSYTTFGYDQFRLEGKEISFRLTNTGEYDGAEVVQIYIRHHDRPERPLKELADFRKVFLKKGESRIITIPIDRKWFEVFENGAWTCPDGSYTIYVSRSSEESEKAFSYHYTDPA